jgi:Cof subfamily protein (haloacid dehalogenase superfamily)
MVISDFDGTLFRTDHTVSEFTRKTIAQFVEQGGLFAISTGRTLQSILPIARELGLKGVIACFNGSVIADIETGKVLFEKRHTAEDTFEICKYLDELQIYQQIFDLDAYYAMENCVQLESYQKATGIKARLTGKPISQYVKETGMNCIKTLSIVEAEKRDYYMQKIREKFGEKYYLTSGGKYLIEICPKGCTKGTAVKYLADSYGIDTESVLAVGDCLNDLPMLQAVGLGLAVANAEPALKAAATVYPYTNDEDAVARIIMEYALGESTNE